MSEQLEIPVWNRGINFKVYNLAQRITYDDLLHKLTRHSANINNKVDGWVTNPPEFVTSNKTSACFIYISFKQNANSSRLHSDKIMEYDSAGFVFDFASQLVILTTSGQDKINTLRRANAFMPISDLTQISGCSYSGKFLFWLSHLLENENGNVCDDICIKDISAITNNLENLNISDVVSANTQVTFFPETKVILGLNGGASGIRLKVTSNNEEYDFDLYSDGRVRAKKPSSIKLIEDKAHYAKMIHNILQKSYNQYNSLVNSGEWSRTDENKYQVCLLKDARLEIDKFIDGAINDVTTGS